MNTFHLLFTTGIHKIARIANREDPDQIASSALCLHCLYRPFWQSTSVEEFLECLPQVAYFGIYLEPLLMYLLLCNSVPRGLFLS